MREVCRPQLLSKLSAILSDLPVLLCGPPGTGKKSAIKSVADDAGVQLNIFDVGEICVDIRNRHGQETNKGAKLRQDLLEKVILQFGVNRGSSPQKKKTLLALYGADQMDSAGAAFARSASTRIINLRWTLSFSLSVWIIELFILLVTSARTFV